MWHLVRARLRTTGLFAAILFLSIATVPWSVGAERVRGGLLALYDFEERTGTTVHDRSGVTPALDLQIESSRGVRWRKGALTVSSATVINSSQSASKIVDSMKQTNAITIEAWIRPETEQQKGPARIVSLSADTSQRNFTLGQEGPRYDVRLRTTTTDGNGNPSTPSADKSLSTKLTHVVYTRDAQGTATLYINGKPNSKQEVPGDLSKWNSDFRLLLSNEVTRDRAWIGSFHFVAIYSRALSDSEVATNFEAGSGDALELSQLLPPSVERRVDFVKDVQPILRSHCYECHSRDHEEGGLNLGRRARALEGGESGEVVSLGDSAASRLIHLVAGIEKDAIMPPEGKRLTNDEIGILRAWIDQGLQWPDHADILEPRFEKAKSHWAFQPLQIVEVPTVENRSWLQTPIDHFILQRLEARGLVPNPPVEPTRLIRRMTFDLIGLPPTPSEIDEFVVAFEQDPGRAKTALMDRLLSSHHFGERWGRHWLDVARYADSDGMESDADRPHAYRYRDFVIRSFNEDFPFDRFIQWQLAGDEFEPGNLQALSATGFLTAGPNQMLEEKHLEEERLRNRYNELDDILSTIGTGVLGLTVGCARCHDHKYDAVRSREYYSMLSAIHSGDRKEIKFGKAPDNALVFQDFGSDPRATWLFRRGNFYDREIPVQLGFIDALCRQKSAEDYWSQAREPSRKDTTFQRKSLALWMTDIESGAGPLAARVVVNRIWQHHFGEGLVRTVNDFGVRGEQPSHPELLEWLTQDFVSHGWKLKRLHRMILSSAVYQQAASSDAEKTKVDVDNRLLWCKTPRRLEAEILRDSMLAVSGTLNLEPFGPAFKPPISAEAVVARNTKTPYPKDAKDQPATRRRSVYMFHKRVVPYPLLRAFDQPDAQQSCGRRDQTIVAPQGLSLLNDEFVRARAIDFANRLLGSQPSDEQLFEEATQLALGRKPERDEVSASVAFLQRQIEQRQLRDSGKSAVEIRSAAVADLCQVLFSLNEFIYVD